MKEDNEAWEQHLDWSLRAIEGGEAPPDVTARVEAIVSGRIGAAEPAPGRRRVLLAAAAALLAIGVVVGVRVLSAPSDEVEDRRSAPRDQEPENHVVDDPQDVESLPADARCVTVLRQGDDVVEQVAVRCPQLQRLRVVCMEELVRQPTNRVFAIAATLPQLRELQLVKAVQLDGTGIEHLLDLPLLETLVLAMTRLDAACFAALPRLPSLRVLDLSYSRGVDDEALRHIAGCPGLRQLGIPGCKDVTPEGLQHIARLTRLEVLEARQLGCAFDEFPIERLERLATADLADATFSAAWLGRLPASLRKLTLSGTSLDDDGCATLAARLPGLRELRVAGTAVGDRGVAALAGLGLRTLDLGSCPAVTAASVETLGRHPRLVSVELFGATWATPQSVGPLFERGIEVRRSNEPAFDHALEPLRRRYAEVLSARAREAGADGK